MSNNTVAKNKGKEESIDPIDNDDIPELDDESTKEEKIDLLINKFMTKRPHYVEPKLVYVSFKGEKLKIHPIMAHFSSLCQDFISFVNDNDDNCQNYIDMTTLDLSTLYDDLTLTKEQMDVILNRFIPYLIAYIYKHAEFIIGTEQLMEKKNNFFWRLDNEIDLFDDELKRENSVDKSYFYGVTKFPWYCVIYILDYFGVKHMCKMIDRNVFPKFCGVCIQDLDKVRSANYDSFHAADIVTMDRYLLLYYTFYSVFYNFHKNYKHKHLIVEYPFKVEKEEKISCGSDISSSSSSSSSSSMDLSSEK